MLYNLAGDFKRYKIDIYLIFNYIKGMKLRSTLLSLGAYLCFTATASLAQTVSLGEQQEGEPTTTAAAVDCDAIVLDSIATDVVHLDDVIITGSLAVGFDTEQDMEFGFSTILLKENNLRIRFDDTSESAAFPNHDWQLTANEKDNGGLNCFLIENVTTSKIPFHVNGDANTNAIYVNSTGVGFGTSTPAVALHSKHGNSPTLRLEQDGSSGFTSQTWDIAGNETNFFVRDVTNGSLLPFRIVPGSPTSSVMIKPDAIEMGVGTQEVDVKTGIKFSENTADDLVNGIEFTDGTTLTSAAPLEGAIASISSIAGLDVGESVATLSLVDSLEGVINTMQITITLLNATLTALSTTVSNLATVASTGQYSDLTGAPTIPSNVSDLTNDAGYTTFDGQYSSLTGAPTIPTSLNDLSNDPGYTSFDGQYASLTGAPQLHTVATSGLFSDLTGRPAPLPTPTGVGSMAYWNGTAWISIEPSTQFGIENVTMKMCNGVPQWGPCITTSTYAPTITNSSGGVIMNIDD